MHNHGPVVVKRTGFLAATAYGLFGFLIAVLICATGLSFFALRVVDGKADTVLGIGKSLIDGLPQWQENLPPMLSDALSDQRDPSYANQMALRPELVETGEDDGRRRLSLVVENNGAETVTLLALRIVLVDANDVPVHAIYTYAATPIMIENDWRGPILPGSTRRCSFGVWTRSDDLTPKVEIADLRLWNPNPDGPQAKAAVAILPEPR